MDKEINERFARIEMLLEHIAERQDRFEIEFEQSRHAFDLRFQRLTEMQSVLMESQNDTWKALDRLTKGFQK
jgi:hypothetical protein